MSIGCEKLAQAHGNVFTVWVGLTPVVVLSGCRVLKEALVSNWEQFSGRPLTPLFRDLFGERGIICSNGHVWRQQRRFCLATLRGLGLGKLALELQLREEAAELAGAFHQEQGRPFDPQVAIVRSTARVIGALVFGYRFPLEDPFFQEMIQAIDFGLAFVSTIWRRITVGVWRVSRRQAVLGWLCQRSQTTWAPPAPRSAALTQGQHLSSPWAGPLPPQLYDLFPWAFCHLPGPHPKTFRYQKAVRGYICQEIGRHKLRTPEAPRDFISCCLAQITKVGLELLQKGGGGEEQRGLASRPHVLSRPWPPSLILASVFQRTLKQQPFGFFNALSFLRPVLAPADMGRVGSRGPGGRQGSSSLSRQHRFGTHALLTPEEFWSHTSRDRQGNSRGDTKAL
ncbi:cytochrome P450 2J5-like [Hippopotamus amphibius kiboko]|uniref:cytochrome P450 2J5-like n=1 Tax=Hippopotamus amphibius kiboko TaxID=575201 RepID=UPI0025924511|nr:cytochrome P450 2J5-like [Hippopotamus amphibius kiboko]